jgi:hypothetical protein
VCQLSVDVHAVQYLDSIRVWPTTTGSVQRTAYTVQTYLDLRSRLKLRSKCLAAASFANKRLRA